MFHRIKKIKKIALYFTLSLLSIYTAYSQDTKEIVPTFGDRLFYGGNFELQLGTITNIGVSPIVGYWILPRLSVAMGPQYRFYKFNDIKANIYGGKAYTELYLIQDLNKFIPVGANLGLFIHLEDELQVFDISPYDTDNQSYNTILFGGGISQPIGIRSSANIVALWAIGGNGIEYYGNPEIRVVFTF